MKYYPTSLSQALIHTALNQHEKRNIQVGDKRRTTVRLEPEFWNMFNDIAETEKVTYKELCAVIEDRKDKNMSLSSAIRVFVAAYLRAVAAESMEKQSDPDMIG